MHSLFCKIISIIGLSFVLSTSSFGQYYEAGGGLGLLAYWGDLNAPELETNLSNSNIMASGYLKYNFNGFYGAKISLLYGSITGDDALSTQDWQKKRNLSFKSPFAEFSILGDVNLFEYNAHEGNHMFTPYFSLGASVIYFNPKTLYKGKYYALQPLGTEGQGIVGFDSKYSLVTASIILGGGIKIKLSETLNLAVQTNLRRTFTDYLDDVSKFYVDYDILSSNNGEISAILANRANELEDYPDVQLSGIRGGELVKDYVLSGMVTISYNFVGSHAFSIFNRGKNVSCPGM